MINVFSNRSTSQAANTNISNDKQIDNSNTSISTPANTNQIPEFNVNDAKAILDMAYKRLLAVTMYGNEQKHFEAADLKNGFYFYSEELNSTEKLTKYLNEVFTDNVTTTIVNDLTLKVVDGRLAFQSRDWGSYSSNLKADIKIIEESKNSRTLEFNYSEFKSPEKTISSSKVEYRYLESKGWRITSSDPQHISEIF